MNPTSNDPHHAATGRKLRRLFTAGVAAGLMLAAGVATAANDVISFAVPSWPGERVKAEVAEQILQKMGYKTANTNVGWVVALKSVATGELSADMALWRPTQDSIAKPMFDSGKLLLLSTNIEGAKTGPAVPKYVWDAGVHSIADLHKFPEKFEKKIYGLEAGNEGNGFMEEAIAKNQYGLAGWEVVESSEAGMFSQVKYAVDNDKWVVFLGWKPHWSNVVWDIEYLEDPDLLFGGTSTVNTAVRPDFPRQQPNVAKFLQQMRIPGQVQSGWIYEYGYNSRELDDVARSWIADNRELVETWLDGVTTADGKASAIDAVYGD